MNTITEDAYSNSELLNGNLTAKQGVGVKVFNNDEILTENIPIIDSLHNREAVQYTSTKFREYSTSSISMIMSEAKHRDTKLEDLQQFNKYYKEFNYTDSAIVDNRLIFYINATDELLKGKPYLSKSKSGIAVDVLASYNLMIDNSSISQTISESSIYASTGITTPVDINRFDQTLNMYYKTISPMLPDVMTLDLKSIKHITPIGLLFERLTPVRFDPKSKVVVFKDGTLSVLDAYVSTEGVDKVTTYNEFGSLDRRTSNVKAIDISKQEGYAYYRQITDERKYSAYSQYISIVNSCRREYDNTYILNDKNRTPIPLPNVIINPNTNKLFILDDVSHRIKLNNLLEAKYSTSLVNETALVKIKEITTKLASELSIEIKQLPTVREIAQFLGVDEDAVIGYMSNDSPFANMITIAIKELLKASNETKLIKIMKLVDMFKRSARNTMKLMAIDINSNRSIRVNYINTIIKAYSISGIGAYNSSDIKKINGYFIENNITNEFEEFNKLTKNRLPTWIVNSSERMEIHSIIRALFNLVKHVTNNGTSDIDTIDTLLLELHSLTAISAVDMLVEVDDKPSTILEQMKSDVSTSSDSLEESLKSSLKLDITNLVLSVLKNAFISASEVTTFGDAASQLEEINAYLEVVKVLTETMTDANTELGQIRTELVEVLDFDNIEAMETLSTNEDTIDVLTMRTSCTATDKLLGAEGDVGGISTGQLLSVGGLSNMGKSAATGRLLAGIILGQEFNTRIKGLHDTKRETLNPIDLKIVEHIDNALRSLLVENIPVSFKSLSDLTKMTHISAEDEISVVMKRYLCDMGRHNIYGAIHRAYDRLNIALNKNEIKLLSHLILIATRVDRNLKPSYQTLNSLKRYTQVPTRWFNPSIDHLHPVILEANEKAFEDNSVNKARYTAYSKKLQYVILTSVGSSRYVRISLERQNPTKTDIESVLNHVEKLAEDNTAILIDYVDKYLESESTSADKRHVYKILKSIAFSFDCLILAPNQLSSAMMLDNDLVRMDLAKTIENSMREPRYQGIATLKTELDIELVSYTVKQLGNNIPIRIIGANKKRYGQISDYPFAIFLYEPPRPFDAQAIPLDIVTFINDKITYTPTCMTIDRLNNLSAFIPQLQHRATQPEFQGSLVEINAMIKPLDDKGVVDITQTILHDKPDTIEQEVINLNEVPSSDICIIANRYHKEKIEGCDTLLKECDTGHQLYTPSDAPSFLSGLNDKTKFK